MLLANCGVECDGSREIGQNIIVSWYQFAGRYDRDPYLQECRCLTFDGDSPCVENQGWNGL